MTDYINWKAYPVQAKVWKTHRVSLSSVPDKEEFLNEIREYVKSEEFHSKSNSKNQLLFFEVFFFSIFLIYHDLTIVQLI